MHNKRRSRKSASSLIFGSFLVTAGCTLLFTWPLVVQFILEIITTLKPDGVTFNLWRKNTFPLYFEIYIFNWTNPEDIYNPHIKPKFEEIGPFVFEESKEKVNITWNTNATITFKQLRYWYFDEARSVANLSTKVFIINPVALAAAHRIRFWNYVMKKGFDFSMRPLSQKIYLKKSVGQILFEGYDDPLIDIAKALPFPKSLQLPDVDKFGWFYKRNGSITFDGTFNMGISGNDFGKLHEWNYQNEWSYFSGQCNKIKGSAGEFYPTNLKRNNISFFSTDICRPIILDYTEDVDIDGITGYKYVAGESFLDNGTKVPENLCYTVGENIPSGALNISSCRNGVPGFLSSPHFYGADPYYTNKLEGLQPDKSKHQMFMILEPATGIPLEVQARFQLNLLVQPNDHISLYEGVPTVYIPVVWFEQKVIIPSNLRFYLKTFLYMPIIMQTLAGISLFTGILLFIHFVWGSRLEKIYLSALRQFNTEKSNPKSNPNQVDAILRGEEELSLMKSKVNGVI